MYFVSKKKTAILFMQKCAWMNRCECGCVCINMTALLFLSECAIFSLFLVFRHFLCPMKLLACAPANSFNRVCVCMHVWVCVLYCKQLRFLCFLVPIYRISSLSLSLSLFSLSVLYRIDLNKFHSLLFIIKHHYDRRNYDCNCVMVFIVVGVFYQLVVTQNATDAAAVTLE